MATCLTFIFLMHSTFLLVSLACAQLRKQNFVCLGLTSVSAQYWRIGHGCQGDTDSGVEDGKRNTMRTR
jgi:hypothetical protein